MIASARPPRSVRAIYAALKLDTWQINYNGALIWDEPSHTVVHHEPMKPKLVLAMIERARDMFEEVAVSCEILDRWYTDHAEQQYVTETGRLFRPDVVAPIEEFCREPVTKILLLGEPRIISRLEQLLMEEYPKASVVRSEPELLQIMQRESGQGGGAAPRRHALRSGHGKCDGDRRRGERHRNAQGGRRRHCGRQCPPVGKTRCRLGCAVE